MSLMTIGKPSPGEPCRPGSEAISGERQTAHNGTCRAVPGHLNRLSEALENAGYGWPGLKRPQATLNASEAVE